MTFYYRELSAQLRLRQVPEARVVEVLLEVRDLCQATGQSPEQQFGPAAEYAKTFPQGKGRSPLTRSFLAFVGVCLLGELFFLVRWEFAATKPPLVGGVSVLVLFVVAQVVAMLATFGGHYRLPKGFSIGAGAAS